MRTKVDDCSMAVWKQWSKQAAELQILRADVQNRNKSGDNFYKMDQESIITILEELSEDFYLLAQVHVDKVWRLPEEFEDEQLHATFKLEAYG